MKNFSVLLLMATFVFMLSSCGGGGGTDAPAEAKITISPPNNRIACTGSTTVTGTTYFSITVKDPTGIPLSDVNLSISYPYAVPDASGFVQLYDDTTPKDSPMDVTTDENGTYYLSLSYERGCDVIPANGYSGDLLVVSGSLSATSTFAVTTGE